MAVSSDLLKSYAAQFLPVFRFADTERVFPVSADSWLQQCADGDWADTTDPHRGTTIVLARVPLSLAALFPNGGCRGVDAGTGPVGEPIDPTQQLPTPQSDVDELFIDFAGWPSLTTGDGFVSGDDDYIRGYFEPYFAQFNNFLTQGVTRPTTRTKPTLPTDMAVYCEVSWAGDFTRRSIANECWDFSTATTNDPNDLQPDPALDKFLVLTYYLFYPCTEPPPPNPDLSPGSVNLNYREGQWEAVSLYFDASDPSTVIESAADLTLSDKPDGVTPAYAILSQGITRSGDGRSPQIGAGYPAAIGAWPTGGQSTLSGGFPFYGKELVPTSVFVTSGTHKNLFSPTPVTIVSDPDQDALAAGAALEGAGGLIAGITGGTGVGLIVGLLAWLIGLIISIIAAGETDTFPAPDPDGDIATDDGPAGGSTDGSETTPGDPSAFVSTDLKIFSTLPDTDDLRPPPWWTFPGRWGVATSSEASSWDSGGRLYDFKGRSRAYWNTVALQYQAPDL